MGSRHFAIRLGRALAWMAIAAAIPAAPLRADENHAQERSQERTRIDRVEVVGVTVFQSDVIENALEIGPGDLLDRLKVIKTEENIQSLYRTHGYEQIQIQSRMVFGQDTPPARSRVLEIRVTEGRPTRISVIDFSPGPLADVASAREAWKRALKSLKSGIGLSPGDVLDQEKITAAKRSLQEILASREYIGAKIEEVQITTNNTVPSIAGRPGMEAGRWVKVEFQIKLGDRVSFGFRGNSLIPSTRLSAVVDEQRTLGLGQDYVNVIGARIQDEYRQYGYARAKVQAYTFENGQSGERHVTYEIDEGPRLTISHVVFDGNSAFSTDTLSAKFFELAPNMVQRRYYVEKDVQKGAELLIEWMKSRGYLAAKLVTINKSYVPMTRADERDTRVDLVIYLYEGEQTLVQSLRISGTTVFSADQIAVKLGVKEGDPLNIFGFSEGVEAIKRDYRARGYLNIAVLNEGTSKVIQYSDENRLADIDFQVSEGTQFHVSRVLIEGRQKTREVVIRRELELHEGDVVQEPKLGESEANLRKLGIFSVVHVTAIEDPDQPDKKILKILVEEADPGVIAGGPGFRNDLGVRAFSQIGYTNLWGLDHSIFLNTNANRRVDNTYRFVEYQALIAYNWPWFGGWDLGFRPTLSLTGTEYLNFDAVTAQLALNWEKKLIKKPNLSFLFTYSLERINQFEAQDSLDNGLFLIGSVTPAIRLDMRDSPLAPTKGLFTQASFDYSDPWLGSQRSPSPIGYYRFQTRTDYTIPLAPMTSWFWSIRTGFEKSTVSNGANPTPGYGAIPLIKQFALGSVGSLRGYQEQELNAYNEVITGTLSYVNYRTQIDLPLSGGLRFGPFLDAANLRVDSFSFGGLDYGVGAGFHYLTPVGPVNLDWGFKLNPQPGTDTNQFYFSIGVL